MYNRLKNKILKLKESSTLVINEKSKELISQGKKVYQFGFGQSPFPVPEKIVETLKDHAHRKEYLPIQGLPKLREAISNYLENKTGNSYPKENILITPGSKEAMLLMHIAFNGEIIIPAPGWVSYEPQAQIGSNKVHWLETSRANNWFPTADELEKKIKKIGKKKNLIFILNSPNNPSGAVCKNLKESTNYSNLHLLTYSGGHHFESPMYPPSKYDINSMHALPTCSLNYKSNLHQIIKRRDGTLQWDGEKKGYKKDQKKWFGKNCIDKGTLQGYDEYGAKMFWNDVKSIIVDKKNAQSLKGYTK